MCQNRDFLPTQLAAISIKFAHEPLDYPLEIEGCKKSISKKALLPNYLEKTNYLC